jgi:hypothetical protein
MNGAASAHISAFGIRCIAADVGLLAARARAFSAIISYFLLPYPRAGLTAARMGSNAQRVTRARRNTRATSAARCCGTAGHGSIVA